MRYGVDLRATRNPRISVWVRSASAFRDQRVEMIVEPANGVPLNKRVLSGRGNTLYTRWDVPLVEQAGDPDVRIKFRYHHGNQDSPAVFIDNFAVEETPRPPVPRLAPVSLEFPNEQTSYMTEGWDVVRGPDGVGRLVTTVNRLPAASIARAKIGPFDLSDLRNPMLRVWTRYALREEARRFGLT